MKYTKIILSFLLIFSHYFFLFADDKTDKRIFNIINGVYEVESWFDGKKLYKYPNVSGRWTFYEGQVISIIHNRINPDNYKSSVRWGKGLVKNKKFKYVKKLFSCPIFWINSRIWLWALLQNNCF